MTQIVDNSSYSSTFFFFFFLRHDTRGIFALFPLPSQWWRHSSRVLIYCHTHCLADGRAVVWYEWRKYIWSILWIAVPWLHPPSPYSSVVEHALSKLKVGSSILPGGIRIGCANSPLRDRLLRSGKASTLWPMGPWIDSATTKILIW